MRTLLLSLCLGLAAIGLHAQPVQVTDDRGVTQRWPAPPRRIVSLLPSLTESLCALGQCQRLVAVDRYSDWPASIATLPRVGGGLDPDIEAIAALRPDAVLAAQSSGRALQRLETLGIQVVTLEPRTRSDVRAALDKLAVLTGAGTAQTQRLWREIDEGVASAARSLPPRVRGTRVYFEVSPAPHAAAPASFIGETLARLGVRNIVPEGLGPFPQLNPEFVLRADPDVVMIGNSSAQALARRPGWGAMRAVREHRVCRFTPSQSDVLVRPGPRMAEAARLMARCLQDKAP